MRPRKQNSSYSHPNAHSLNGGVQILMPGLWGQTAAIVYSADTACRGNLSEHFQRTNAHYHNAPLSIRSDRDGAEFTLVATTI